VSCNESIDYLFVNCQDPKDVCQYLLEKTYDGMEKDNLAFTEFAIDAFF